MNFSKCFSALTILGALTFSVPAWADIAPDDLCFADDLDQPCDNAEGDGDGAQAGVCREAMCTRATPDGSMTYACFRCEPVAEGTGGQSNGAGGAGGEASGGSSTGGGPVEPAGGTAAGSKPTGTAGTKSSPSGPIDDAKTDSDGGGCSLSRVGAGTGALTVMTVALGMAFLGLRRRRSLRG